MSAGGIYSCYFSFLGSIRFQWSETRHPFGPDQSSCQTVTVKKEKKLQRQKLDILFSSKDPQLHYFIRIGFFLFVVCTEYFRSLLQTVVNWTVQCFTPGIPPLPAPNLQSQGWMAPCKTERLFTHKGRFYPLSLALMRCPLKVSKLG